MRAAVLVLALSLGACAPAMPTFSGATTTPEHRGDLLLGGAYRAPLGGLARSMSTDPAVHNLESFAAREGTVPAGAARIGLSQRVDLGIVVAGPGATLDLRYAAPLDDAGVLRLLVSARPFGMWTTGDAYGMQPISGALGGFDVPVLLTYSASGVYEAWFGAHVAGMAGSGDIAGARIDAAGVRVGGIAGFLIGFQSFAALFELAVDYESWFGHGAASPTGPTTAVQRDGVVLTPAFAIRFRI